MRYMLLIYGAEDSWTEGEREECMLESSKICDGLRAEGKLLDAAPLHSVDTATSVRVRDGKRQITDGPFAETTEQLGGYYLIDVGDLDEAIAIASRIPPAKKGTVEIRPLFPLPQQLATPSSAASR
ncbi:MAG: YciI family protein [Planctomycetales bacterium]|nr:YciI family protein [Planctomycetales bacterium]